MRTGISAICIIVILRLLANAERILILTGAPFFSHQVVHRAFNLALHKRGHELVVLTASPLRDPTLKNYTEIDVSDVFLIGVTKDYNDRRWKSSQMESCRQAFMTATEITAKFFDNPEFKKIYRRDNGEKFDAVIVEAISDLSLFAVAHRFKAPLIGIMSLGIHNYQRYIFGSPMLPSHPSTWEINTLVEGNPSFWQRLQNFIDVWSYLYYWTHNNAITEQKRAEEYFGSDTPNVVDIVKNMSILLVNENPALTYARPEQPNVIFFTGFHIQKTPPLLPEDLRQFLDDATEGFIYVSLGTTVSCDNLPTEIVGNFIQVFSKLPYKIVWKYECDELPGKLDNAFISKWFPQQGVLGKIKTHHNIRLFIYQGGLQSTEEAIHYAVPLLGIPIMFEQASRIQRLASLGAAIFLKLNELSKERLNTAIHQILNDKSYKERMAYLSELSKDQPYDSLENAIWWVEYVMRHKGISHLRFSESDKPWYQRYDMDIIGFLAVMTFVAFLISFYTIFRILRFIYHYYQIPCHNFQYSNAKSKIQFLHKRGHELVIVTTAPLKDPTLKNYTKIDVSYGFSIITEYNDAKWKISQMESCRQVFTITTEFMGTIWDNLEFKKIYRRNSGEKFDAIMMEPICDLSLYSMAHRFNAPLIGLTPMGFHNFQRYIFASPMLPSHPSNWEVNTLVEGYPSFWQKLQTFIDVWGYLYAWSHHVVTARKRVEKYFGSDTPDPMDIAKNMSIVLVNENPLFAYVRPEQPNVIYFSGFQIQKTPPTLPKVFWKYECDEFPGKLDNIFISKWFPHQGILAHHNIRLFIYQGGVHSTEEAIHYAVPLLGIPIMFEQASRIQRLASLGAAIFLKLNELSKERLNTAIHQILNDKSYKERMAYLSELSKDQPYDSLENAIWWVEYVMRHKGISHLRFSESDKPWYQRYDMDIIGIVMPNQRYNDICVSQSVYLCDRNNLRSGSFLKHKMRTVISALYVILFQLPLPASAARILILTGAPFFSHQVVHRSFSLALLKRGHELVVVTPSPLKDPTLKNYTEIDMSHIFSRITDYNDARWKISQMESCRQMFMITNEIVANFFTVPEFKKICRKDNNEKFDAVIIEAMSDLSLYVLAHRFNAPLIGILSLGIHNYHRYIFGSPILPSHPSNWEVNTLVEGNLSFWQRLQNFIDVWSYLYYWTHHNAVRNGIEENFESDTPNVIDIVKNMSIFLVNENPLFAYARPEQPNVIFFTGFHIQKTPPLLPEDLRQFLDDATEGFLYVSLGTTVSCRNVPKEIVGNFIQVFSKLRYKIVWKYECDELPGKLDNALMSQWFPQQGILAHPNIRLFIYQGGQQSTEEAVHYAVPLLGIPIIFEQASRIQRLASLGAAILLKLNELNKERLNTAIHQILNDKSYKERMVYLSELSKDQPYDSLENAIWWVEYVMRHKGISHLRFSESDKPWYQRYDMDIIGFLAVVAFVMSLISLYTLFRILRFCCGYYQLYKNIHYPNIKFKMQ
ncbi:uncharacterized protein LOC105278060 [Ooceraea biroi]|uniref:uncharacterized protein LOC105278060 n=1 Tax=Ooceraea biroi TaxID=2015173 RepID=UPI000F07B660|nr:uncharacterized protein LOC105278060 [Ooceraea biroi]